MIPLRWPENPSGARGFSVVGETPVLRCCLRISLTVSHKPTAVLAMLLLLAGLASATTHKKTSHSPSKTKHSSKHSSKKHGKSSKGKKVRGQRSIDDQRAQQIQTALIREHYLDGEPTGQWDQRTRDAMQKYQSANGWQTKVVPDSRALIKLGLGPSQENLINPETAATAAVPVSASAPPTGGGTSFRQ
jgi:peptidoglycan hydrolase-like protein with peptidoglycan-binding domain